MVTEFIRLLSKKKVLWQILLVFYTQVIIFPLKYRSILAFNVPRFIVTPRMNPGITKTSKVKLNTVIF